MKEPSAILKKGKDKAIRNRHHWIFSGAVHSLPPFEDGAILPVRSFEGDFLGYAYFNSRTSIIGRLLSFDGTPPLEAIEKSLDSALSLRRKFLEKRTNACRLVNAEGDHLPGLIVDRYENVLVLQVATLGMEKLKPFIINLLIKKLAPRSIFEKSNLAVRAEEGLADFEGHLYGEEAKTVEIEEDGLRFVVDIVESQKTGFFLDLREMRGLVRSLAGGKRVLNCFCYTGAFSVAALAGGALAVDSVDTSERAVAFARHNLVLNGFSQNTGRFFVEDVFSFLRKLGPLYDLIILDPPAFAKKRADIVPACRGYKDINRLAMQKISSGGLLLTFCCSYFVNETLFQQVIFQAAGEAGRKSRILQRHRLALDHPVNIFHPETDYLKSFLLGIE